MNALIIILALCQGQVQIQAKIAFDNVQLKVKCTCPSCDCIDCKCNGICICTDCNYEQIYAKAIKDKQVIVLAIASPALTNVPWKIITLKQLSGEKPGYIVGVPKDGKLIRLDFPPSASRQRIRLDILHVYYPLTEGYVECPTCPYGRTFVGK